MSLSSKRSMTMKSMAVSTLSKFSVNSIHAIANLARGTAPDAYCQYAIQPVVLLRRRLKEGRDTKVVFGWIDIFATREPADNLGRSVKAAGILCENQVSIVGSQHDPYVQGPRSIRS